MWPRLSQVTLLCVYNPGYCEFAVCRSIFNWPWLSARGPVTLTVLLLFLSAASLFSCSACWCGMQWKWRTGSQVAFNSNVKKPCNGTTMLYADISSLVAIEFGNIWTTALEISSPLVVWERLSNFTNYSFIVSSEEHFAITAVRPSDEPSVVFLAYSDKYKNICLTLL
jgi:hypothetical protein